MQDAVGGAKQAVMYIYIHIYAFSRRFYPKQLTVQSGYTFYYQYACSLGIDPQLFALLTQCSTTEPQEHTQECRIGGRG